MRELNATELTFVSGGHQLVCEANRYAGVSNPDGFGRDMIAFYEGLVFATSHIIERVANAL